MSKELRYSCKKCGQKFVTRGMLGVPHGMWYSGCRVKDGNFYCEDCVEKWNQEHGVEFESTIDNPTKQFSDWWNKLVEDQVDDKSSIRTYRQTIWGDYVEVK